MGSFARYAALLNECSVGYRDKINKENRFISEMIYLGIGAACTSSQAPFA